MTGFHFKNSWRNQNYKFYSKSLKPGNHKDHESIEIEEPSKLDLTKKNRHGGRLNVWWILLLMFEVCLYSSYSPLVHVCQIDGKVPFSSSALVLFIEICKLCISLVMFIPEVLRSGFLLPSLSFCLPLTVPAFLYSINNNLSVIMQSEMDPTSYQVLSNMKIASTALLYRLIMKRQMSNMKWFSLVLLTLAGILDSLSGSHTRESETIDHIFVTLKGLVILTTYCFISGLAGVYTEFIFKKNFECSIHLQNIILYIMETGDDHGIFYGFTVYTWMIIISQAVSGLIMSVIMKYGSNITRLFIVTCAMILTMAISVLVFHIQLSFLFICAVILVVLALYLYQYSP